MSIDNKQMVLKITENAKKCALFTSMDYKTYNKLPNCNLDTVTKFWAKKYKTHNTYNQLQAIANKYKSTAYTGPPTSSAESIGNNNETYISILKEMLACLTMERELAFAGTTRSAKRTPSNTLATNTMNKFCQQLMTEMKNEMAKVLDAATTAAKAGTGKLAQEAAQDVRGGRAGMEATHYVPTAERMGGTSLTNASRYQHTRAKSWQTSLMGSLCMKRR